MKVVKEVTVVQNKIAEVKCNMCGKNIETDTVGNLMDYLSVDKRWGYGTVFDSEEHSFDLCEECYAEIISRFKIPVK